MRGACGREWVCGCGEVEAGCGWFADEAMRLCRGEFKDLCWGIDSAGLTGRKIIVYLSVDNVYNDRQEKEGKKCTS